MRRASTYIYDMPSIEEIIQQSTFESAQQKVMINLVFSGGWAKSNAARTLKAYNLTWQQFNLMRILKGQKGKAVPLRLLSSRMLDPQSNASRLVDKLVEKKWIDRVVCHVDKRQVRLSISHKGAVVLEQASLKIKAANSKLGGDLSVDELNTLSDLLDRFRNQRQHNDL
jgi:DNA-binding MarR family transcriptional regulator